MNVYDLQNFLRSLSQPLSVSGAKKAADDLQRACAGLEPFRDLSVAQFSDFLARAEEFARTGVVATTGRSKDSGTRSGGVAVDPQAVVKAIERVRALHDRVTNPEVTYGVIETEVKQLGKQFKKPEVLEIAKEIGIRTALKTKQSALNEIQQLLIERKESFERTRF